MITKKFGIDFKSDGGALTLNPSEVCENHKSETGNQHRTHPDGWTIYGEIKEDWIYWVNKFTARHPQYGSLWGDFENEVYADSEEAFQHFYKHHTPQAWDYGDI